MLGGTLKSIHVFITENDVFRLFHLWLQAVL